LKTLKNKQLKTTFNDLLLFVDIRDPQAYEPNREPQF
jgi:hypothetical protein